MSTEPAAAPAGTHARVAVTTVATPVAASGSAGGWQIRRSIDLIEINRLHGRVTGSRRVPASAAQPAVRDGVQVVDDAVRLLTDRLAYLAGVGMPPVPYRSAVRLQSLVVAGGTRLRALARMETAVGPVLAGAAGPALIDGLPTELDEIVGLPGAMSGDHGGPPADWRQRPLLLRPAVAAAVLAGARWVLGTAAAERLYGRRMFPRLTLSDLPVEHDEEGLDDGGWPATAYPIILAGRVMAPPVVPGGTMIRGRAVWRHDQGALGASEVFRLTLSDLAPAWPGPDEQPACGAVELLRCVETLRRYHPDGSMRLRCLARTWPAASRPFLVEICARPLSLLRTTIGAAGRPANIYDHHEVGTASLVLPSAEKLRGSPHVEITAV